MKVMVIGAHADDEVLGCGGVIARHVAAGDEVSVTLATRGDPQVFPPELLERLEIERILKRSSSSTPGFKTQLGK